MPILTTAVLISSRVGHWMWQWQFPVSSWLNLLFQLSPTPRGVPSFLYPCYIGGLAWWRLKDTDICISLNLIHFTNKYTQFFFWIKQSQCPFDILSSSVYRLGYLSINFWLLFFHMLPDGDNSGWFCSFISFLSFLSFLSSAIFIVIRITEAFVLTSTS